jgi:hypothetical protein
MQQSKSILSLRMLAVVSSLTFLCDSTCVMATTRVLFNIKSHDSWHNQNRFRKRCVHSVIPGSKQDLQPAALPYCCQILHTRMEYFRQTKKKEMKSEQIQNAAIRSNAST